MGENELFAWLSQLMPGKVFMPLAPQGEREPYIVYSLVSGTPRNTMVGSAHLLVMNYRVDVYARTRAETLAIFERLFAAVDASGGDPLIRDRQDFYEPDTRINRISVVLSTQYEPEGVQS